MWGRSWDMLFLMWVLNWPSTIHRKDPSFPLDHSVIFVLNAVRLCLLLCFQALASVPWVSLFLLALIPHCLNSCSFIKTLGIQFRFSSSSCLGCCWPLSSFYMRVFAMVPPTPRPLHMFLLLKHPSLLSSPGYSSDDTLSCHFLREAFPGPPGPGQMPWGSPHLTTSLWIVTQNSTQFHV